MLVSRTCRCHCFLLGLFSAPLFGAIFLTVLIGVGFPRIGPWLDMPNELGNAGAVVVLSGGGPERMIHGIALYQQGWAPELWYTGDRPLSALTSFSDGQIARYFALAQGVPDNAIRLLPTTSTWEDGQKIAGLVRKEHIHSIIVVTDWYHSRRALCVIQKKLTGTTVRVFLVCLQC